jgi:hypothetical protein
MVGRVAVIAKKESENYLAMDQFYGDGKFETAILTSQHRAASVRIRLGPMAGQLDRFQQ